MKPVDHPKFEEMLDIVVKHAGAKLPYLMIPKPRGLADLQRAVAAIEVAEQSAGLQQPIALHALVETHGALREVQALSASQQP